MRRPFWQLLVLVLVASAVAASIVLLSLHTTNQREYDTCVAAHGGHPWVFADFGQTRTVCRKSWP